MIKPKDPLARFHARQARAKKAASLKNLKKAQKAAKLLRDLIAAQNRLFVLRNNPYINPTDMEIRHAEKKLENLRRRLLPKKK